MNPSTFLFNPVNIGPGQGHAWVKGQVHEMGTLPETTSAKRRLEAAGER